MKRIILPAVLMLMSLQATLFAQTSYEDAYFKRMTRSKADQTFNAWEGFINIRDFVVLREGRLILELSDVNDYESFQNLDSLLADFRKNIAFYKDSLDADPTGHVRIDYVINPEYSFKKIRIKRYHADGSIFMNQDGDISRLKYDQDTIRLIVQKSKPGMGRKKVAPCTIPYTIQATFVLGNYYDADRVLADKVLNKIVDTLEKASQDKRSLKRIYTNPLSIIYNPYYAGKNSIVVQHRLISNEFDVFRYPHKSRYISLKAFVGAGVVQNTIAPMAELGVQYNKKWNGTSNNNFFRLSAAPYYLFDRTGDGKYTVNDNWFVNADFGSVYDKNQTDWVGKECSIGVGYLVAARGGYFRNNTFKVFTDIRFVAGITIVPEFIVTDNLKQVFPGITVKVF